MIAVGNRTTSIFKGKKSSEKSKTQYKKYLLNQALETTILDFNKDLTPSQDYITVDLNSPQHNYAMGDILKETNNNQISPEQQKEIDNHNLECLKKYTYMTGDLAKKAFNSEQDYLTPEILNQIADLEMGEHEFTKNTKKGRTVIKREVKVLTHKKQSYVLTKKDIEQEHIIIDGVPVRFDLEKDIKTYNVTAQDLDRGYFTYNKKDKIYFPDTKDVVGDIDKKQESFVHINDDEYKVKTAIEFTYTLDSSFSYYIQKMDQKDRDEAIKIYNETCAEIFKEYITPHLKNYNGEQITDYLMYQVIHLDNRKNDPFLHCHQMLSAIGQTADGRQFSIEVPAINEKSWHTANDIIFQQRFAEKFTNKFGNVVEAYDKDFEQIDPKNMSQQVKGLRIAYDKDTLLDIKDRSVAPTLIKEHINKEKKELKNAFEAEEQELKRDIQKLKMKFSDKNIEFDKVARVVAIEKGLDKFNVEKLLIKIEDEEGNQKVIYHLVNEEKIVRSKINEGDLVQFDLIKSNGRENQYDLLKLNQEFSDSYNKIDNLEFKLLTNEENYHRQLQRMNTRKYENDVWTVIKNRKEDLPISVKVANMNTTLDNMTTNMNKVVGETSIKRGSEEIFELLTNIDPFFTFHQFREEVGRTGEHRDVDFLAQEMIKDAVAKKELIQMLDPVAIEYNRILDEMKKENPDYKGSAKKPEVVYLKTDLIQKEKNAIESMRKLAVDFNPNRHIDNDKFEIKLEEFLKDTQKQYGFELSEEQVDYIRIFASNKGLSLINGSAGVGKSFTLKLAYDFMKKLYKEEQVDLGHNVKANIEPNFILIAPSGKVASDLSSAVNTADNPENVPAMTIDKFLMDYDNGKFEGKLNQFSTIVADEGGMLGVRTLNRLMEIQKKHGFSVRLIGDAYQLEAVAVGSPFQTALEDPFLRKHFTFLKNIRRQETDTALAVAHELALTKVSDEDIDDYRKKGTHIKKVFEMAKQNGNIKVFDTVDEKVDYMSVSLIESKLAWKNKAVITSENAEVQLVNQRVQEIRLRMGDLDIESSFRTFKGTFYANDRIVIGKNNEKEGYNNGDFGTIVSIENGKVTIALDNGKTKTLKDQALNKLELCYGLSTHKSQGMTLKGDGVKADLIDSPVNNQNLLYVMLTRGTKDTEICVVKNEMERAFASFERMPNKIRLLDLGRITMGLNDGVDLSQQPLKTKEVEKEIKKEFKKAKVNVEDYSKVNANNDQVVPMKELDNPKFKPERMNLSVGLKTQKIYDEINEQPTIVKVENRDDIIDLKAELELRQLKANTVINKNTSSIDRFAEMNNKFKDSFNKLTNKISSKVKSSLKKQKDKLLEKFGVTVTQTNLSIDDKVYADNYYQNHYNYLPEIHDHKNTVKFNNGSNYETSEEINNKPEDLRVNGGLLTSEARDNIKALNPEQHKNNEIDMVVSKTIKPDTKTVPTVQEIESLKKQNQMGF